MGRADFTWPGDVCWIFVVGVGGDEERPHYACGYAGARSGIGYCEVAAAKSRRDPGGGEEQSFFGAVPGIKYSYLGGEEQETLILTRDVGG